jgi:flagellar biosynthesis protein FlhF
MKQKTFKAGTMREALALVKKELGGSAVIVSTRSYRTGGFLGLRRRDMVEITASLDAKPAARVPAKGDVAAKVSISSAGKRAAAAAIADKAPVEATTLRPTGKRLQDTYGQLVAQAREQAVNVAAGELKQEIGGLRQMVERLIAETRQTRTPDVPEDLLDTYVSLIGNEVADDLAKDLVRRIVTELPEAEWKSEHRVREVLVRYVASRIEVAGPTTVEGPTPRVIALIGPTGVGKTTTIAKLAAQFKLRQGRTVGLITIDTYRIAAVDQLRTYADIIDVPLKVVLTPRELRRAIEEYADKDVVLIDTAGRSQRDVLKMNELRQFLEAAQPAETHLVISTTANEKTALAILDRFGEFEVDRIILTKLDEAVGFGIVLSVLGKARQKLSYVTVGQDVPDDIEPGNPRKLAELIVPSVTPRTERAQG